MPDFENSQSSISDREDAEQSLEIDQLNLPHSTFNPASIQRQGRSTTEVELRLDRPEQVLEPISDTVLGHDNTGISVELTSDRILRFFYDNADINPYVSNNVFEEIDPTALSIQSDAKWALKDTGASHHMFNELTFFISSTIKPIENKNKRLRFFFFFTAKYQFIISNYKAAY